MESKKEVKIIEREKTLRQWLKKQGLSKAKLKLLPGDASFRRYFRLTLPQGSFIVMDAPPPVEDCKPFIHIAKTLREMGLQAPEVIEADSEQGFLLISDFGDLTYLRACQLKAEQPDQLYQRALMALALLQSCPKVQGHSIPLFTADLMHKEWELYQEWFLEKWLMLSAPSVLSLRSCYEIIVESAISQPQVFMHRDYHSANLMVLPENKVGILDFQDAYKGPITYDAVSLLRDCYIDWPEEMVKRLALFYFKQLQALGALQETDPSLFLRWFDLMGLQRHLKALMTFARKKVRDQQSSYLNAVPRTLRYLLKVSKEYPDMIALHTFLGEVVEPAVNQAMSTCAQ